MMIPGKLERREFLSVAGAAVAGAAFPRLVRAQDSTKGFKKIDIHVHLGRDREEMGQITKDKAPAAVKYLIGEMDRHNVEKSMIVAVEPLLVVTGACASTEPVASATTSKDTQSV